MLWLSRGFSFRDEENLKNSPPPSPPPPPNVFAACMAGRQNLAGPVEASGSGLSLRLRAGGCPVLDPKPYKP